MLKEEQVHFNNTLIKSFQSKGVKETISSILGTFFSGKTKLSKKENLKRLDSDSEELEDEYYVEKENTKE